MRAALAILGNAKLTEVGQGIGLTNAEAIREQRAQAKAGGGFDYEKLMADFAYGSVPRELVMDEVLAEEQEARALED